MGAFRPLAVHTYVFAMISSFMIFNCHVLVDESITMVAHSQKRQHLLKALLAAVMRGGQEHANDSS